MTTVLRGKSALTSISFCLALTIPIGTNAQSLTQLLNNGPSDSQINIVFLAEGYTSAQQADFLNDADEILNYTLSYSPYDEYLSYFNAYAIFVASAESGSDHPSSSLLVDTYFNSSFDSNGITRLVTIPPNSFDNTYANGAGKVVSVLSQFVPNYDIPLLVVNDDQYGGSGGWISITSTNSSAPDIAVHEIGHSFADLSDEYTSAYPGWIPHETTNSTQQTNRASIAWNAWIDPSTPVPTEPQSSYPTETGLFEGAQYQTTGWFRPSFTCTMRSLGGEFCEVCAEQHVAAIYDVVSTILSVDPATSATIVLGAGESQLLNVTPRTTSSYALDVQWYLDGVPVAGATDGDYMVDADALVDGEYQLSVTVTDNSSLVRITSVAPKLVDSEMWTLDINTGTLPVEIVDFAALQTERAIKLSWRTLSESQNAGFTIQHAAANHSFADVSFLPSAATPGATPVRYSYFFESPEIGLHRFRLKQVDLDGSESYSPTVEIDVALPQNVRISAIAPNPFSDRFSFTVDTADPQNVRVEVYDLLGRLQSRPFEGHLGENQSHQIDLVASQLSSGTYVVVITGDRFRQTRMVTKR